MLHVDAVDDDMLMQAARHRAQRNTNCLGSSWQMANRGVAAAGAIVERNTSQPDVTV